MDFCVENRDPILTLAVFGQVGRLGDIQVKRRIVLIGLNGLVRLAFQVLCGYVIP